MVASRPPDDTPTEGDVAWLDEELARTVVDLLGVEAIGPTAEEVQAAYDEACAQAGDNPGDPWNRIDEDERRRVATAAVETRQRVRDQTERLGYGSIDDYLAAMNGSGPEPPSDVDLVGQYLEPEDRGQATLSPLGDVEYVEDLVRPGRIVVVAAEEGTGKSYAITGELGIRVAVAGGSFAGTWPVLQTGPVLVLSEMHADDDYTREETILAALGRARDALTGRYFRLPLMRAAGEAPALTVAPWRSWLTTWLRDKAALLLIVDTATGATRVDPWGSAIHAVYAGLRAMLDDYPDLAIVLVLHLKKPNGRGERRISDVLGEWGRWNDVTIMLEGDGPGSPRTKVSTFKRVRRPRRIIARKADGLLVDAVDLAEGKAPKVPIDAVAAAITADPGLSIRALGQVLEVSTSTATKYARAAEEAGLARREELGNGRGYRLYPADFGTETLDTPPSTVQSLSSVRAGRSLDGGAVASKRGTVQPSNQPVRVGRSLARHPTVEGHNDALYRLHQSSIHLVDGVAVCDACAAPEPA
jgi:hypothetical protein